MRLRRTRARLLTVAVATGVVTAGLAAPSIAAPNEAGDEATGEGATTKQEVDAPVPDLDWESCGPDLEEFLCATAEVPTDYDAPDGPTTTIALTKLPATDPESKIGTLFTNPGGPGGPGVDFVQQMAPSLFTPKVRANFDILGFDPRGVGASDPVTCFDSPEEEGEAMADMIDFPTTKAEEPRFLAENAWLTKQCQQTSGERMAHSSTANVARDMDLLRQAVGDEKLSYIGYSYGTLLGATYGKLFPDNARALVLDGAVDPEEWTAERQDADEPLGVRMGQAEAASETFDEFLRLCAEAGPDQCALAAFDDPAQTVEDTLQQLKDEPAEVELPDGDTVEISYQELVAAIFGGMYGSAEWPELAQLLADLATDERAVSPQAAQAAERLTTERSEDYPSLGGSLASMCMDTGSTGRPHAYSTAVDALEARAPHFGAFRGWVGINCEFTGVRDDDAYLGPWEQEVEDPVLVIGTRYDPATPYDRTQPYADHFSDARILTVEGWGHTTLSAQSECADDAIADYLVDLDAADGTTCEQDAAPFEEPVENQRQIPQELLRHLR